MSAKKLRNSSKKGNDVVKEGNDLIKYIEFTKIMLNYKKKDKGKRTENGKKDQTKKESN